MSAKKKWHLDPNTRTTTAVFAVDSASCGRRFRCSWRESADTSSVQIKSPFESYLQEPCAFWDGYHLQFFPICIHPDLCHTSGHAQQSLILVPVEDQQYPQPSASNLKAFGPHLGATNVNPIGRPFSDANPGIFTRGTCNAVHIALNLVSPVHPNPIGADAGVLGVTIASYPHATLSITGRNAAIESYASSNCPQVIRGWFSLILMASGSRCGRCVGSVYSAKRLVRASLRVITCAREPSPAILSNSIGRSCSSTLAPAFANKSFESVQHRSSSDEPPLISHDWVLTYKTLHTTNGLVSRGRGISSKR